MRYAICFWLTLAVIDYARWYMVASIPTKVNWKKWMFSDRLDMKEQGQQNLHLTSFASNSLLCTVGVARMNRNNMKNYIILEKTELKRLHGIWYASTVHKNYYKIIIIIAFIKLKTSCANCMNEKWKQKKTIRINWIFGQPFLYLC